MPRGRDDRARKRSSLVLKRYLSWEADLSARCVLPQGSRGRWFAALGAHLGDGLLWAVIGLVLAIWGSPLARGVTVVAAAAVLLAAGIVTAVKYTVRRRRPWEQPRFYAVKHDRYSFPSGHATRMAAIAAVLAHYALPVAIAGYLLATVVAFCRVLVGVHYVSDVVVGTLIGLASAGIVLALLRILS